VEPGVRVQRGLERLSADQEEAVIRAQAERPAPCRTAMRVARVLSVVVTTALVVAACGKTGGTTPLAGVYHLQGSNDATSLELRSDGTFTLRRDSCESAGVLTCGDWTAAPTGAHVDAVPGMYWPTPDTFPSAVVRRISLSSLGGDLVVVGESDWAGTFTERWVPGRTCAVCKERLASGARACDEPMPTCARM
jgi:hypothetical protein